MAVEQDNPTPYVGRFAPSPNGPLHFGSLVTAMASYLQARANQGQWQVRIEDIDPPREVADSADDILRTLERLGFEWDGPVHYQSTRFDAYAHTLELLREEGLVYPCACSRSEISRIARKGIDGAVYPGTCRKGIAPGRAGRALRVVTDDRPIRFRDALQGTQVQVLERDVGDFVLQRADGYFSYQLAVVVDDAYWGVTEVVRGYDLLVSTPRQIHLQALLSLPTPTYAHLPLALDTAGEKLSKHTHAPAIADTAPVPALCAALRFLGHRPPPDLSPDNAAEFWKWAIANWDLDRIPAGSAFPAPPEVLGATGTGKHDDPATLRE